jgi:TPR repeat protein
VKDLIKAKKYFEVAAAQGDSRAQLQLTMLEAELQQTEQIAAVFHITDVVSCHNRWFAELFGTSTCNAMFDGTGGGDSRSTSAGRLAASSSVRSGRKGFG